MVLFNPFFNCDRCRIILHHPCILRFQKLHLGIAFRTLHKPAHCCFDCSCRFGLYRCECWFILSILTFLFIFHLPQPADTTSELLEYPSHSSTTTTAASRLGSILVLWRRWYTTLRHWWTFTLAFPTSLRRCCRRSGCFGAEWGSSEVLYWVLATNLPIQSHLAIACAPSTHILDTCLHSIDPRCLWRVFLLHDLDRMKIHLFEDVRAVSRRARHSHQHDDAHNFTASFPVMEVIASVVTGSLSLLA